MGNERSTMASATALAAPRLAGTRTRWARVAGYAAMLLAVTIVGMPLFWMLSGSLKTSAEVFTYPPTWLPSTPQWGNYVDAWHAAPFGRFYVNSLIIMIGGTAIKMVNAVCTAYALVFLRVPGRTLIFLVILAG